VVSEQITDHYPLVPSRALEQRLPPRGIVDVPLNRLIESMFEIVARFPLQLTLTEGRIDGVTTVVPQPVGYERDRSLRFSQFLEDELHHLEVHHFPAAAQVINRARF